jgi:signal transduction histidine kinase
LEIWVEDNGNGIDPTLHELIFDKFFQAKNQTLRKPGRFGAGFGYLQKNCRNAWRQNLGKQYIK